MCDFIEMNEIPKTCVSDLLDMEKKNLASLMYIKIDELIPINPISYIHCKVV